MKKTILAIILAAFGMCFAQRSPSLYYYEEKGSTWLLPTLVKSDSRIDSLLKTYDYVIVYHGTFNIAGGPMELEFTLWDFQDDLLKVVETFESPYGRPTNFKKGVDVKFMSDIVSKCFPSSGWKNGDHWTIFGKNSIAWAYVSTKDHELMSAGAQWRK